MNMQRRVERLEASASPPCSGKWHLITKLEGQTDAAAIDAYGRDKVAEDDNIIFSTAIAPRFDADGNMIPYRDWPENKA